MKDDNLNRDFIEKCRSIDFSSESVNKEKNLEILKIKLNSIEEEKELAMNKKVKKPIALIAVVAALLCLSAAVYGQELVRIIKTVTLGDHAEYFVVEDNREFVPIPDELKGLVFDKDGNALEIFPENHILYNEHGEEVRPIFDDGKARLMTTEEFEATDFDNKSKWSVFTDREEGKGHFICETLSPSYLPAGYVFDRIEFFGDPTNQIDIEGDVQKYMSVYYTNGKNEMYSQVRYMDEKSAFGSSATEIVQRIKINGYDAVLDIDTLDIQIGDVMYMFFAPDGVSNDELIKMAKSLK